MANDKRNQQESAGNEGTERDMQHQQGSEQTVSTERDANPQRGEDSANLRTGEVSNSNEESGENFYRNRERGNYEEGQTSDDDGGGGSLY